MTTTADGMRERADRSLTDWRLAVPRTVERSTEELDSAAGAVLTELLPRPDRWEGEGETTGSRRDKTQRFRKHRSIPAALCLPARTLHPAGRDTNTHRHLEGTVGDMFASKPDTDHILARLWRRVEDVKGTVLVFHHVHIEFSPLGRAHAAGHLAFPSSLCINRDNCLFTNLDGWADASTLERQRW